MARVVCSLVASPRLCPLRLCHLHQANRASQLQRMARGWGGGHARWGSPGCRGCSRSCQPSDPLTARTGQPATTQSTSACALPAPQPAPPVGQRRSSAWTSGQSAKGGVQRTNAASLTQALRSRTGGMVTRAAAAGRAASRTAAVELHTACAPTTAPAAAPCPSGLHILREGTLLQVSAGAFSILCPGRRPAAADQKPPARMHILASIRTPLWSCGGAPCLVLTPQGRSLHLPLVSLNGRSEASAVWGWGQASDRGYWPAQQRHFGCLYPRRRRWAPHGRARRRLATAVTVAIETWPRSVAVHMRHACF